MVINRKAVPPRTPPITLPSGGSPLLEGSTDAVRYEVKEGGSDMTMIVLPSGPLALLEGSADAVRDEGEEGRLGVAKIVIGATSTNVAWDDKGVPDVETDGVFDANGLDDEDSEAEVESEGLPTVAAPISKRADVVLQQRAPSPLDSQQWLAGELYPLSPPHSQTLTP